MEGLKLYPTIKFFDKMISINKKDNCDENGNLISNYSQYTRGTEYLISNTSNHELECIVSFESIIINEENFIQQSFELILWSCKI